MCLYLAYNCDIIVSERNTFSVSTTNGQRLMRIASIYNLESIQYV